MMGFPLDKLLFCFSTFDTKMYSFSTVDITRKLLSRKLGILRILFLDGGTIYTRARVRVDQVARDY